VHSVCVDFNTVPVPELSQSAVFLYHFNTLLGGDVFGAAIAAVSAQPDPTRTSIILANHVQRPIKVAILQTEMRALVTTPPTTTRIITC